MSNYQITPADALGQGGPKTKARKNLEAIRLLKQLEQEGRTASEGEQAVLVQFSGWGTMADLFTAKPEWAELQAETKSLLTKAEYDAAKAAILNAHYSSADVVNAVYDGLAHLGFNGGRILDPSMGATGLFEGLMPPQMQRNSEIVGVELDSISGRIARQLYPDSSIHIAGFEDVLLPDNYFDLSITNVPFLEIAPVDPRYQGLGIKTLHDYFFVKALDAVRPGGMIAFITSVGTMQSSRGETVRPYLAERANLVGAMRIPGDAFKLNAGTEVTSDLIILQKLGNGVEPNGISWLKQRPTSVVGIEGNALSTNEYFMQRPHLMLGTPCDDKLHPGRLALKGDGRLIGDAMREAFQEFPAGVYQQEISRTSEERSTVLLPPHLQAIAKPNGYVMYDGQLMRRSGNELKPVEVEGTKLSRIQGMMTVRDAVQAVFDVQLQRGGDLELQDAQAHLNEVYDHFVEQHGFIHERGNKLAFGKDPDYFLLLALENYDVDRKTATKTSIFSERTIQAKEVKDYAETAKEGLLYSLNEKGRIDLSYIAQLTGQDQSAVVEELQQDKLIFLDPTNDQWITNDEYLSGNVRRKLAIAEDRARTDAHFQRNVEALKAVQPEQILPGDIEVRLGSTWVPERDIAVFAQDLLETKDAVHVNFSRQLNAWYVSADSTVERSVNNLRVYGTPRVDALRLIELALNLKDPVVYDPDPGDKNRRIVNTEATVEARMKMEDIKLRFKDWVWQDNERCERLVELYNEKFNTHRPRQFDGSHLSLPGSNPAITLRPYQRDAVWRVLQEGNTLLAHACGGGKTFTMIAGAMEQKRLGISRKPMLVVPNHMLDQFAGDFKLLYPNANILAATKEDSAAENRKELMSRIATGNWDSVIVTHSGFGKLALSPDTQMRFYDERMAEIDDAMNAVEASGDPNSRRVIKDLERKKKWVEQRLDKLDSSKDKDFTVTFEQLGVDQIYIDEAHYFKNLGFSTKMYNVAGLPNTVSGRAFDLYMKVRYLAEAHGEGKGVCLATGTPIANTMAEMYIMQRYLQPEALKDAGVDEFDSWASTFGETVTAPEITTAGDYKVKTRFARFVNLPELMNIFRQVADIQTPEMLNLPVPQLKDGSVQVMPCPATDLQLAFTENLAKRADNIKNVDPRDDNMLLITTDGRKASLDMRLIHPSFPDDPNTKVNQFVRDAVEFWEETRDRKLTHLVFCDLGTPKQGATSKLTTQVDVEEHFSVYLDLKQKLVQRGIPENKIAFVQEFKTDAQKREMQHRFNRGDLHMVISGAQLETGFNGQRLLALESHLTVPWRPDQVEQRDFRITRQGNTNAVVEIRRYVTQGRDNRPSFDSYSWQTLENKKKAIDQVMNGKSGVRNVEDVAGAALTYAEVKAIATGNPLIMEKATVDNKVNELAIQKRSYLNSQYRIRNQIQELPKKIDQLVNRIERTKVDLQSVPQFEKREFERQVTVGEEKQKETFGLSVTQFELVNADPKLNPDDPRDVSRHIINRAAAKKAIGDYRTETVARVGNFEVTLQKSWDESFFIRIQGQNTYDCDLERSFISTYANITGVLAGIPTKLSWLEHDLKQAQTELRDLSNHPMNAPFSKEKELQDALNRQKEINRALGLDKDNAQAGESPIEGSPAPEASGDAEAEEAVDPGEFTSAKSADFVAQYLAEAAVEPESVKSDAERVEDLEETSATEVTLNPLEAIPFPVIASTETLFGPLSVRIDAADDEFHQMTFEGAIANWSDYPSQTRVDSLPVESLEEMEFSSLQEYAQFAVEQVASSFLVELGQEVDRITPALKQWLKQTNLTGEDAINGFLAQYPEADRRGLSPELQRLVVQTAQEAIAEKNQSAPSSTAPEQSVDAAEPSAQPEPEPVRLVIQSLETGRQTFMDLPPLPEPKTERQAASGALPQPTSEAQGVESSQVEPAAIAAPVEPLSPPHILPDKYQVGQAEKNVAKFLHRAELSTAIVEGEDFYLRIENSPYLPLVVEQHNKTLYLTHYREVYGDLIHDGEMVFQIQPASAGIHFQLKFRETAVQNSLTGGESRAPDRSFATLFSRNILEQGFAQAAVQALAAKQQPESAAATPAQQGLPVEHQQSPTDVTPQPIAPSETITDLTDLQLTLMGRLSQSSARLTTLQQETGNPGNAEDPLSNPVNSSLKDLRDRGLVEASKGWGSPLFKLTQQGQERLEEQGQDESPVDPKPEMNQSAASTETMPKVDETLLAADNEPQEDALSTPSTVVGQLPEREKTDEVAEVLTTLEVEQKLQDIPEAPEAPQAIAPPAEKAKGFEEAPSVDTPVRLLEPEPVSADKLPLRLLERLQSEQACLDVLQQEMGYPLGKTGNPTTNRVCLTLKSLRDQGLVDFGRSTGGALLFQITAGGAAFLNEQAAPTQQVDAPALDDKTSLLNRANDILAIAQQSYAFGGEKGKLKEVDGAWRLEGKLYTLVYEPAAENFWIHGTGDEGMTIRSVRGRVIEGDTQRVTEADSQQWHVTQDALSKLHFHSVLTPAEVQALAAAPPGQEVSQQGTLFNLTTLDPSPVALSTDQTWEVAAAPPAPVPAPEQSSKPTSTEATSLEQPKPLPTALGSTPSPRSASTSHPRVSPSFAEQQEIRDQRIQQFRETPLEEVAIAAGLGEHRGFWREQPEDSQYKIKITPEGMFFDVKQQEGGHGAISLAKFVKGIEFLEACRWLDNNLPGRTGAWESIALPTHALERRPLDRPIARPPAKEPEKAPICNVRDPQKWQQVERYLTQERGLPVEMIRSLHEVGRIDSDSRANVMFMRERLDFNWQTMDAIGANTRATLPNQQGEYLKLMTPLEEGVKKSHGFFTLQQGEGSVMRVVITEGAIDAMSYAALDNPVRQKTVYLSTDGAGNVPTLLIQQVTDRGGAIVLAQDADRAGYLQAFKIAKDLTGVPLLRRPPVNAHDWNDQLRGRTEPQHSPEAQTLGQLWHWYTAATNPQQQLQILEQAIQFCKHPNAELSPTVRQEMKSAIVEDLKHWYRQSKTLGRSERHLDLLTAQAKEFIANDTPLPRQALWTRQLDSYQWHERVGELFYQAHHLLDVQGHQCGDGQTILEGRNYTLFRDDTTQRLYGFTTDDRRNHKLTESDRQVLPDEILQSGRNLFLKVEGNRPVLSHTRIETTDIAAIERRANKTLDRQAAR